MPALEDFFAEVLKEATKFLASKNHEVPRPERWGTIATDFRNFVPTSEPQGLAEIINAGWDVYHDNTFPSDPEITDEKWQKRLNYRKLSMINELVLKSVEILEIQSKASVS